MLKSRTLGGLSFLAVAVLFLGFSVTVNAQATSTFVQSPDGAAVLPECFGLPMVGKDGANGAYWANHPEQKTLNCNLGSVDLTQYSTVTLHMHSAVANDAFMVFVISSENPNTDGPDYYRFEFYIDWSGDRALTFNLADAKRSRTPIGWHHIDSLKFWADFGGITPPADTELTLWRIEFR